MLTKLLQPGVNLVVCPTEQFKTVKVRINFALPLTKIDQPARLTLLACLMEQASAKYANQRQLSRALAALYGANYSTTTNKRAKTYCVSFHLTVANPQYLPEELPNFWAQCGKFLNEVINFPKLNHAKTAFDEKLFTQQKQNMTRYLNGVQDNKKLVAFINTYANYFTDDILKMPAFGNQQTLASLDETDLYHTWQQLITTAKIDIIVNGNISFDDAVNLVTPLNFAARNVLPLSFDASQKSQPVKMVSDSQPLNQARLNLLYQLTGEQIKMNTPAFFALLVFNGLFGGSVLSRLFKVVREQHSLAYTIGSSFDLTSQTVLVQSGVLSQNIPAARNLIDQQLAAIQAGEFSLEQLAAVKAGIKTAFLARSDSQTVQINRQMAAQLDQPSFSYAQLKAGLSAVDDAAIINIAQKLRLQLDYRLLPQAK